MPELPPAPPEGLWDRLRADPSRAPETLALAAAERHGPAAAAWMAGREGRDAADLAAEIKRTHVTMSGVEGGVTGIGGALTILPDLVALAWIQSRMVFFLAAAHGLDPRHEDRAAELLVLQELYDDVPSARSALAGTGRRLAVAMASRRMRGRDEALVQKLLRMVGRRVGRRIGGRLIPGVAAVAGAWGNSRETSRLADRAIAYYRDRPR